MGEYPGEIRTEETVDDENAGDDYQGPAHGASRRFQHQNDGHNPHDQIQLSRVADPLDQVLVKKCDIDDACAGHHGNDEIHQVDALAFGLLRERIEQKAQGDGERQVDRSLQGRGQHPEKGRVKLKAGKSDRNQENHLVGDAGESPFTELLRFDHLRGFFYQSFVAYNYLFHSRSYLVRRGPGAIAERGGDPRERRARRRPAADR